jgi:methyl-accepting chemotaxis protein
MLKKLKQAFKKQRTKHQTTKDIRYDAFGNAIPNSSKQSAKKDGASDTNQTQALVISNNTTLIENEPKEYQLAKALSQQMHHALDKMNHQLSEREMRMEARFETLEATTIPAKDKKHIGLYIVGGILAGIVMVYLLYIMQNMQTSMQSMSGDIGGMTDDITQMSKNTESMSSNMEDMNKGVADMNENIGGISDSIEPMGETAKTVSPFAEMFNRFSPF